MAGIRGESRAKHKGDTLAQLRNAFRILNLLQRGGGVTRTALSEELGISTRQVDRYIEVLEGLGAGLEREEGGRLVQPMRLNTALHSGTAPFNVLFLNEKELLHLYTCIAGVPQAGDKTTRDSLWEKLRLSLAVRSVDTGRLRAALGSFEKAYKSYDTPEARGHIAVLLQALYHPSSCRVTYRTPNAKAPSIFRVEPYELIECDGGLYLYCNVPRHGEVIVLAVERIEAISRNLDEFRRSPEVEAKIQENKNRAFRIFDDEELLDVKLKFTPQVAFYAKERVWHPSQTLKPHRDGSVTLHFQASGRIEIERWIRSWGEDCKVLRIKAAKAGR